MKDEIYSALLLKKKIRRKSFALLIDPDKVDQTKLPTLVELAVQARVDYLFVGGSLVVTNHLDQVVLQIKSLCKIPIILFPGTPSQVSAHADALLYLSLISGRNPELLIGTQEKMNKEIERLFNGQRQPGQTGTARNSTRQER